MRQALTHAESLLAIDVKPIQRTPTSWASSSSVARKKDQDLEVRRSSRARHLPAAAGVASDLSVSDQHGGPIPLETLRDLLGIARALYAAWVPREGPIEMEELRGIGADLRDAYRLAARSQPGTTAHRAAWVKAERATRQLGDLLGDFTTVKSLVASTSNRLGFSGGAPAPFFDRNAKHRERRKRG
jgi:hypothetical protein